MAKVNPLRFKVAPHIVEDLGLNLYTTLPRVLVEFVANAYDADSPNAQIRLDLQKIKHAREALKLAYSQELERASNRAAVAPLETRLLPDDITITIEDRGHGMSRDDLDKKFLFAGRRRRHEELEANGRSANGRPLMGRKGLGKLAGFGVAKKVEVLTRKKGESHATRILLDYESLVKNQNVHEIDVDDERVANGGGIQPSGTKIILSRLLYDPLKHRPRTIEHEIAEFFSLIDPTEFLISVNGIAISPEPCTLAYAWPKPELPVEEFVEHTLPREGGGQFKFRYRMRFTGDNAALEAAQRGVRVYAHKRLAAAPSLLKADTNMHGFRMTDYLDGVVHADFIDEEPVDYVATDRASLRWESPLLAGLHSFLSEQIKEACKNYQKLRDDAAPSEVKADEFTMTQIGKYDFSKKDRHMAIRIATILKKAHKRGLNDPGYQSTLPAVLQGLGHGQILTTIAALASETNPSFDRVVEGVVKLTMDEFDQFMSVVRGRINGVSSLKRLIERPDFNAARNEKTIQSLCETCPWLVNPTYTQFLLAADVSLGTVFKRMAQELEIGEYASTKNDKSEPDLVFLIGNLTLRMVVIVELKASNVTLNIDHLTQLEYYMEQADKWLTSQGHPGFRVLGHLIGTLPSPTTRSKGATVLWKRMREAGPDASLKVREYLQMLNDAEAAHQELLDIHLRMEREADKNDDGGS